MFYLVSPDMTLYWVDLPVKITLEAIERHGAELGNLDWIPAERQFDQQTLDLAWRHGIACSKGIAIPAVVLTTVDRPGTLKKAYADLRKSEATLAGQDEIMEALMPGWKNHGKHLSAEVHQSTTASIKEAQADADALLAAKPKPELVNHWERLTGYSV